MSTPRAETWRKVLVNVASAGHCRVNQRKQLRTQEARDRLWRLLLPLFTPQSSHRHGQGCYGQLRGTRAWGPQHLRA